MPSPLNSGHLLKPNPRYEHVFAVLRYETEPGDDVPIDLRVTVTKIFVNSQQAEKEVARLNELNRGKGSYYFMQVTRIEPIAVSVEPGFKVSDVEDPVPITTKPAVRSLDVGSS